MLWSELVLGLLALISCVAGKPYRDDNVTCGYDACPYADTDKFNVHLIPHSHDDLGWQKTVDGYFNDYMIDIFNTVTEELLKDPKRKFVQTETAYLAYWWAQQDDEMKDKYRHLINNGQIEIVNGAWCSNDEAITHYQAIIDQFTIGHRWLEDELGPCARTNVGWQVDTFGHSREMASLYSQIGVDGFLFTRFHWKDIETRKANQEMDLLWIGSQNLGVQESNIFTSIVYNHYSHPNGFCFDAHCNDQEITDDNLEERVNAFADIVREQGKHYTSSNVLVTMGDDFQYTVASKNFGNMDRLIAGFEKLKPKTDDGKEIVLLYSSPSCYSKAVNDHHNEKNVKLNLKYDDFFPHAHTLHEYWVGFYTSRPTSKRYERIGNNVLQAAKQLSALTNLKYTANYELEDAIGIMQHHDAITGTEEEDVEKDYHLRIGRGIDRSIENIELSLETLTQELIKFEYCPLANVSVCAASAKDEFTVLLYNPLGREIQERVRLPVNGSAWTVLNSEGEFVAVYNTKPIREFTEVGQDLNTDVIYFTANIPALGFKVYTIKKPQVPKEKTDKVITKITEPTSVGFVTNNVVVEPNGLISSMTIHSVTVNVKQQFMYYLNDHTYANRWIFTPDMDNRTAFEYTGDIELTITEGRDGVAEVKQRVNDYITQIIRIYQGGDYIELDWVVGPLPVTDQNGIEVISRFTTDLKTDEVFYTDSNSRELIKRFYKKRPTYEYTDEEPQSSNYFPVSSRTLIEDIDSGLQFGVITDRGHGAASLGEGQLEIMLHRACVGQRMVEEEYGQGVIARGSHWISIGKSSKSYDNTVTEYSEVTQRKLAQQAVLRPIYLFPETAPTTKVASYLKTALPENVHLLTFAKWEDKVDTYLVRLEHYFEQTDDLVLAQEAVVDLANLFTQFTIESFEEKVLSGVKPLSDKNRLKWNQLGQFQAKTRKLKDDGLKIVLAPMEIRTFVVKRALQ